VDLRKTKIKVVNTNKAWKPKLNSGEITTRDARKCEWKKRRDPYPRSQSSRRENDDVEWLLSRDSIDYFVNFNLYACTVVFLGRLRATRTTPLTRRRKAGNFTCSGTWCDMRIKNIWSGRDSGITEIHYCDTRLLATLMKSRDTFIRRFSSNVTYNLRI